MAITDDNQSLTEEQRRQRERDDKHRAYLASADYSKWSRLERRQHTAFKSTVDGSKPFFDFLRMVLTTSLLVGIVGFAFARSPLDENGDHLFPVWAIPMMFLAALSIGSTWSASSRFIKLFATRFAIKNSFGYKVKRGHANVLLYLLLWSVQLFLFASVAQLGWVVAKQAVLRGSQMPCDAAEGAKAPTSPRAAP